MRDLKKNREEIIKKWEESGFLDGLSPSKKENLAELYQAQEKVYH